MPWVIELNGKAILGIAMVVAGIMLMLVAGARAGLFLIFPFVIATGPLGGLGILLVFLGSILFFLSFFDISTGFRAGYGFGKNVKVEKRGMGIVLLGPIPLVIDTKNKKLSLISIAIFAIAMLVLALLILRI